jgi:hypothetical protein
VEWYILIIWHCPGVEWYILIIWHCPGVEWYILIIWHCLGGSPPAQVLMMIQHSTVTLTHQMSFELPLVEISCLCVPHININ